MKLRSSGLWFLAFPLLCMGQTFDTTPPTLVSFDFTPKAPDVTAFSWSAWALSALIKLGLCNGRSYNTRS
jgi:hypothetical protein